MLHRGRRRWYLALRSCSTVTLVTIRGKEPAVSRWLIIRENSRTKEGNRMMATAVPTLEAMMIQW
ncbi:hypothetical protein D3C78_1915900 [compost metagenome]